MLDGKSAKEWIDLYVDTKPAGLRNVAEKLRKLVKHTVKGTKESVNSWKIPTFESHGPMCFFMVGKYHVTFGFLRGTSLPDPGGLLEGTGKNLRHAKLRTAEDVQQTRAEGIDRGGGAAEQEGTDETDEDEEQQEVRPISAGTSIRQQVLVAGLVREGER